MKKDSMWLTKANQETNSTLFFKDTSWPKNLLKIMNFPALSTNIRKATTLESFLSFMMSRDKPVWKLRPRWDWQALTEIASRESSEIWKICSRRMRKDTKCLNRKEFAHDHPYFALQSFYLWSLLFSCFIKQLKYSFAKVFFFEISFTIFVWMYFYDSFFEDTVDFFRWKHINKRNFFPLWPYFMKRR